MSEMKRVILLSIVVLLTGCPAHFSAAVKNNSEEALHFERLNQLPDVVLANQEKAVNWQRGCQIVTVNGSAHHLIIGAVPNGTYEQVSNREMRFNVIYEDGKFYLQNKDRKLLLIKDQSSCENT